MKSIKDSGARFTPWQSLFSKVENLEVIDEEDEEVRLQESVVVVATLWIGRAALIWGLLYYFNGEYLAGSIPLSYSILTLLSFQLLQHAGEPAPYLPFQVFPDGSFLSRSENRNIAKRIGLHPVAEQPLYDLIIVGAGPFGLTAVVGEGSLAVMFVHSYLNTV